MSTKKLVFPPIGAGGSETETLTLQNSGTEDLSVLVGSPSKPFSVISGAGQFTLTPGSSKNLVVQFSPLARGRASGALPITTNDTARPSLNIKLKGSGLQSPAIALSKSSANPGDELAIQGSGFDPNARTRVLFVDPAGHQIPAYASSTSSTAISVTVPPFLDDQLLPAAGSFSVFVSQGDPGATTGFGPASLQVADLPVVNAPAGAVTLAAINGLRNLAVASASRWSVISGASQGTIDSQPLTSRLSSLRQSLSAIQRDIQSVANGSVQEIEIGTISGTSMSIDQNSLAVLDRMFVAFVLSHAPSSPASAAGKTRSGATATNMVPSDDPAAATDTFFQDLEVPQDPSSVLYASEAMDSWAESSGAVLDGVVDAAGEPAGPPAPSQWALLQAAISASGPPAVDPAEAIPCCCVRGEALSRSGPRSGYSVAQLNGGRPADGALCTGLSAFQTDDQGFVNPALLESETDLSGILTGPAVVLVGDGESLSQLVDTSQQISSMFDPDDPSSLASAVIAHFDTVISGIQSSQRDCPPLQSQDFMQQPSFVETAADNCGTNPSGTACLYFDDGYIWRVSDASQFDDVFSCNGTSTQARHSQTATYYHILGTDLVNQQASGPPLHQDFAISGGTFTDDAGGGISVVWNPITAAGQIPEIVIHAPDGTVGSCPVDQPKYESGEANNRSFCVAFFGGLGHVPLVAGVYTAQATLGASTFSSQFTVDLASQLSLPCITNVTASATEVAVQWTAPSAARSFFVYVSGLGFFTGVLLPGSARSTTFSGLSLTTGYNGYNVQVLALSQDVVTPGPITPGFNISYGSTQVFYPHPCQ